MKASLFLISTLKEAPADAEIASHRLMTRAGMIRKMAGGIYTYLPMGLRVIRKVEQIIRSEMNRAGAIELLMPVIQPAELWQESGRWDHYGPELLRIRDRHERDFIVQPTSEEVITEIARQELRSYRQMPKNFYHIQTKFRDERRPRFGVMRGREFTMKDAYSFDRSREAALHSYHVMFAAYQAIFKRLGLRFRAVAADTGAIGGSASHEFQVIAQTGEDVIAYCPDSDYAANVELAEAVAPAGIRAAPALACSVVATPGLTRCEDVAAQVQVPLTRMVKTVVVAVDGSGAANDGATRLCVVLLRGDHMLNEIKLAKCPGLAGFRLATEAEIMALFSCPSGFLGPLGMAGRVRIVADRSVVPLSDFVCGANQIDAHCVGVNWGRDVPEPGSADIEVADVRDVVAGDPSPDGRGVLAIERGIEVGHVFYLGIKYSEAMHALFVDEDGRSKPIEMGCYGIGVTRLPAAAIEQNHDERGIVWPRAMAPFDLVITPLGYHRSETVRKAADALYDQCLQAGIDVMLDDRDERPGAMFADWELIGVPLRVTVGERGLKDGVFEITVRRGLQTTIVACADVMAALETALNAC